MNKISVIIPVYNVEKYLAKCLDSVLNQAYKNIEVICIDDGSTDNSGNICDEYVAKYENIKVVHKSNRGVSDARNVGIDISTGSYLCFIDSDDILLPDFIEFLYNMCINNDADVAECDYQEFEKEDTIRYLLNDEKVFVCSNVEMQNRIYTINNVRTIITCNKLYKKHLFDTVRFPVGRIHEDEFTIYKVLYIARKIAITNRKMYCYRRNAFGITKKAFSIKRYDAVDAFEERMNFYNDNNEIELYKKSCDAYQSIIEITYCKTQKYIKEDKIKYKVSLVNRAKDNYKNAMLFSSGKQKLKHILFRICPYLYYIVYNLFRDGV